jgi:photosystem II stability/assembly factor-like uncharacterized protein
MKSNFFTIKQGLTFCLLLFLSFNVSAQDWESIATPVTTNLILYDISIPKGQEAIAYTGGSHVTYNGKGTIMKTHDKGTTWEIIYQSNDSGTGVSAINFLNLNKGFAGTQGGSLLTTTDGGENWVSTDFEPNANQGEIRSIAFYDDNNGVLLTGWEGIYITADGGSTWVPATTDIPGAAHLVTYADADNLFAVGNQQVIFKSSDGGHTWSSIFNGPNPAYVSLGVHFADANHGLVVSEEGNVFVTADGGENWTSYIVANQFGLMRGALVVDENVMYATGTPGAVYKTIDGGENWTTETDVDFNPSYYTIKMTEGGTLFVTGSGGTGGTILRKLAVENLTASSDVVNISCNGESTGAITFTVTGGSEPYTYEWSTGATESSITGLSSGTYSCTVTDAAGTTFESEAITVTEPQPIIVNITISDETVDGAADGSVNATITGGTPGYSYLWNNGVTTEDLGELDDGEYCLTVTDNNGCVYTTCATVMAGVVSTINIPGLTSFKVFPNPLTTEEEVSLQLQFSTPSDIKVQVINANGEEVFSFTELSGTTIQKSLDFNSFPAGTYVVKVVDLEGGNFVSKKLIKVR